MQLLQIANKVSKCVSLIINCRKENQRLRRRLGRLETDYGMLSDDLERLYMRLNSYERTESRLRQSVQ